MNRLAFFDTNIFVYSDDTSEPAKQQQAIRLVESHQSERRMVVSLQVLQEYFAAATRKLGMDAESAQRKVEVLARSRVVRFAEDDVIAAIELHRLNRISFWDAMIVHAARLAGANVLYTEDMQHGSVLAGVRVENPFLAI
jgi:predicted nucleic acid-binding protein